MLLDKTAEEIRAVSVRVLKYLPAIFYLYLTHPESGGKQKTEARH